MIRRTSRKRSSVFLTAAVSLWFQTARAAEPQIRSAGNEDEGFPRIDIVQQDSMIRVTWPMDTKRRGRMTFDLAADEPLIQSIAVSRGSGAPFRSIADSVDPVVSLRVGKRDLQRRGGWTIFFDRMQQKPSKVFHARMGKKSPVVSQKESRARLTFGDVSAGPFFGEIRWTFFAGSAFVLQEAVLQTNQDAAAYLYDTGLVFRDTVPNEMAWRDPLGNSQLESAGSLETARRLAVGGRTICAEFEYGSIALFPPPHRYFYPLDFSDNLANIWVGPDYEGQSRFGFGIRHDPRGDDRFVPWFNAPPGTSQELGLFLFLSDGSAEQALKGVAGLTRNDRFAALPGHIVFTSHYHVEHTRELLNAQTDETRGGAEIAARLPSGQTYQIPERLQNPGFVRTFRDMGVDVAHLAEFHSRETPSMPTSERVRRLELLHAECKRLSGDDFLLLPGEEPNVHLGGHWISFFPKPVYWVLHRAAGTPFVTDHPRFGKVYHVGDEADVLRLLEAERGLAWTAHPRIKSSTGFPDRYRQRSFFTSERFLGAAWKAMPADLSQPRLGSRVLDLLDDMSNWGEPKYVVGEVDVFAIEPDHELFGHMNVNYLRLEKFPRFENGWRSILDALRGGRFFVTTGEVLISEFSVNGHESGEVAPLPGGGKSQVRLDLNWTFPLAFAEIISGDGRGTKRKRVELSATGAFGEDSLSIDADLIGQRWVRVEVWDIATNGAFT